MDLSKHSLTVHREKIKYVLQWQLSLYYLFLLCLGGIDGFIVLYTTFPIVVRVWKD